MYILLVLKYIVSHHLENLGHPAVSGYSPEEVVLKKAGFIKDRLSSLLFFKIGLFQNPIIGMGQPSSNQVAQYEPADTVDPSQGPE